MVYLINIALSSNSTKNHIPLVSHTLYPLTGGGDPRNWEIGFLYVIDALLKKLIPQRSNQSY